MSWGHEAAAVVVIGGLRRVVVIAFRGCKDRADEHPVPAAWAYIHTDVMIYCVDDS